MVKKKQTNAKKQVEKISAKKTNSKTDVKKKKPEPEKINVELAHPYIISGKDE